MKSLRPQRLCAALMLASLTACTTVGPDYKLPENSAFKSPQANAGFIDSHNDQISVGNDLPDHWWSLYQDPTLDALVEQALQDNIDLKVAAANLQRSAAILDQARAAGGFDSEAHADVSRAGLSGESFLLEEPLPVTNLSNVGLGVSYQVDLFGKIRRGVEAAHADHEAEEAAADLARISVAAQVVGSYVGICHTNLELQVANHSVKLAQHTRDITARMVEAGRGTPPDLARANAQLATLQAGLPLLQARREAAEYQLAALLGRTPGQLPEGVAECAQPPELSQPIPVGDGRTLLARRPDIRQAERKLAAATAEVGIATAELYPDISLGGSLGVIGQLAHFGQPATQQWTLGPLISWSLPGKGAHARVAAAKAGTDIALGQFDKTVLNALREVQTALSDYSQDLLRTASLQQAQQQAQLAAEQNRALYQAGRKPFLTSLDAERSLASADMSLASARAKVAQDQIRLFLTLGGGWQQSADSSEQSSDAKTAE